jgi:transposase
MPLRWTVPGRYPQYHWERCLYLYYVKNMRVVDVADAMLCHQSSVWRMLRRFNKGEPLEAKGSTGARHVDRTITPLILRHLLRLVRLYNAFYLDEIVDELQRVHGVSLSVSTVCRALKESGFTRKQVRASPLASCCGRPFSDLSRMEWVACGMAAASACRGGAAIAAGAVRAAGQEPERGPGVRH